MDTPRPELSATALLDYLAFLDAVSGAPPDATPEQKERIERAAAASRAVPVQEAAAIELALEALQSARAGLEWYRDRCPEAVDASDDEADELIARAVLALAQGGAAPTVPAGESTPIPVNEEQAALMTLLGTQWLEQNAPHRLKATALAGGTIEDDAVGRACIRSWDYSEYTAGCDAVHPMYLSAFFAGWGAALQAAQAAEPEGITCLRCGFVTYIADGESPGATTHRMQMKRYEDAGLSFATSPTPPSTGTAEGGAA